MQSFWLVCDCQCMHLQIEVILFSFSNSVWTLQFGGCRIATTKADAKNAAAARERGGPMGYISHNLKPNFQWLCGVVGVTRTS